MEIETEEQFDDDPGERAYQPDDLTLERGVITTPYDAPARTLFDEIKEKVLIVNPRSRGGASGNRIVSRS